MDLNEKMFRFQNQTEKTSIFVLLLGVVNHWVTLVMVKPCFKDLTDEQKEKILKN